ncbi:hypothetical protein M2306_003377 [Myroides gitamensis]|nr:hypothetical protein [Myroides gitamensis]
MFSNASSNSTSLATETPSFVTVGAPNAFPMITFLPFGPKVTLTAFAKASTPRFKPSRASMSNLNIFCHDLVLFYFVCYYSIY